MSYLVFNTEAEAIAARNSINQIAGYPKIPAKQVFIEQNLEILDGGLNEDGEPIAIKAQVESRQLTTDNWAQVHETTDGKYFMPRPSDKLIQENNISEATLEAFRAAHNFTEVDKVTQKTIRTR